MPNMTASRATGVSDLMGAMRCNAAAALDRVGDTSSADELTGDQFKALAKEVEEVGEMAARLERANPHIVPALFEVPYGKWQGWSGLENYRNTLAHRFGHVTPESLYAMVTTKLALPEVVDLLGAVTSVEMTTAAFAFGPEARIRNLPRTSEGVQLLPGASVIVLRFDPSGELMAARSWRDERDNWRASIRWVRTQAEDDEDMTLGVRDTDLRLVPRPLVPDDDEQHDAYSLITVPTVPFAWHTEVLSQADQSLTRKRKR